jgi:UDP-glucose 4-epimerase
LVDAHILGLEWSLKKRESGVFNLGTKNGFSVKEVIEETKNVIDKDFDVETHGRRAGDPAILVADNERAVKILKWEPKFSLRDMIESDYLFRK